MPAPALSSKDVSEIIGAAFDVHNHLVQTYKLPFASYDSHDEFKTNIEHLDYSDWAKHLQKALVAAITSERPDELAAYMAYVVHTHVEDAGNRIDLGITLAAMWTVVFKEKDAVGFLSEPVDRLSEFVKLAAAQWTYSPSWCYTSNDIGTIFNHFLSMKSSHFTCKTLDYNFCLFVNYNCHF